MSVEEENDFQYDLAEAWSSGSEDEVDTDGLDLRREFWMQSRGKKYADAIGEPSQTASSAMAQVDLCRCGQCGLILTGSTTPSPAKKRKESKVRFGDAPAIKMTIQPVRNASKSNSERTTVSCSACKGLLHAVYCSKKCLKADAKRHRNECRAVMDDTEIQQLVKHFQRLAVHPTAKTYWVGGSKDHRVKVQRKPSDANGSNDHLRPIIKDPLLDWKSRFNKESNKCGKPWVSFGTQTSVVVSWLPPFGRGRYFKTEYNVEMREASSNASDFGPWKACPEQHTGTVPSHIVSELKPGNWVQFRVQMKCENDMGLSCSDPSDAFQVGFADCVAIGIPEIGKDNPLDDFTKDEKAFFMTLNTPALIQEYLDSIPMDHEILDDTCLGALESVRQNQAHCIEGALLGAYILSLHGFPPYLMDLRASAADDDHIVTPFKIGKHWGCLSVSNHASLRFRNPVYRTLREMIMSYFDDYMNGQGERTLRAYSLPINLKFVFGDNWHARRGDVYEIAEFLDVVDHYKLIPASQEKFLRPGDEMVLSTTVDQREWQAPDNFDEEQVRRNENK